MLTLNRILNLLNCFDYWINHQIRNGYINRMNQSTNTLDFNHLKMRYVIVFGYVWFLVLGSALDDIIWTFLVWKLLFFFWRQKILEKKKNYSEILGEGVTKEGIDTFLFYQTMKAAVQFDSDKTVKVFMNYLTKELDVSKLMILYTFITIRLK